MTKIDTAVDVVSTLAAFAVLYSIGAPWWAYLAMVLFAMAQRHLGRRQGRRDTVRSTILAAITSMEQRQ